MVSLVVIATIFLILVCSRCQGQQVLSPNSVECPPGFTPANVSSNTTSDDCKCSNVWKNLTRHHQYTFSCADGKLQVFGGYCMTYNKSTNSITVGSCPYNLDHMKLVVPRNFSKLNSTMCEPFKRKGEFCGECEEGYKIMWTRSMHCTKCRSAWLKYVASATLPSTILFVGIMIFNIKLAKSPLNVFTLYCQVIFNIIYYDIELNEPDHYYNLGYGFFRRAFNVMRAVYGVFSLDFHYLYRYHNLNSICFESPPFKSVHLMMLQYFESFYPLALIMFVYFLVYLYSKNFKPFVWIWNAVKFIVTATPLRKLSRNGLSLSECFANALVAFLVLAHTKILFTSLNLLLPSKVHIIQDTTAEQHWVLYFDPTVAYFGREHIPYAIFAMVILCIFVIFPILVLALVPFRPFAALFRCVFGARWLAVNYVIDTFQGWYRTRLDGSACDYRVMSALFPVLKCLIAVWISLFTGLMYRSHHILLLPAMVFQCASAFFAFFKPYKQGIMNAYDSLMLCVLHEHYRFCAYES